MKFIAVAFTLKGQSFEDIKKVLEVLSKQTGAQVGMCCLVHGFMPREVVVEKGFGTEVVDALKELFPFQLNCYNDGPQRDMMAAIIKQTGGEVYTIGEIKEGVQEEALLYERQGLFVNTLPLGWVGNMVSRPPTEGEYRVRTNFNAAGSKLVDEIKKAGAHYINLVNDMKLDGGRSQRDEASFGRLKAMAMTKIEEATSDAVKAATV